jgi:hypothetical protein
MKRLHQLVLSVAASIPVASAGAFASNQYAHDDGAPNSGLSYGIATDFCWFHSFTTFGPADSITKVQVMWEPGSIPPGTPVTVCVWEDPNDDGDPSDAILVSQQASTVPSVATYAYTTYPVAPALVHNRFFVGAFVTTDGSFGTIGLIDFNTPLTHIAYFATDAPGFFDPALLSTSFYNHIETIGTMFHGVFMLRAEGAGTPPVTYCTAKTNSAGCTPQIGYFGTPSVSAATGFHVYATGVVNRAPGLLIYGTSGRATIPFGGGWLCMNSPIRRTQLQNSGGNPVGVDCSGTYHLDFGAWIATGTDPGLIAGTTVEAQYYSRDNGFAVPNNIGLTNALEFTLVP